VLRWAPLGVALALLASCACREGRHGPAPERFVPAAARVAAVAPELGASARTLADLLAAAATFPGAGELAEWRTLAGAQLGFDPLDPRALRDAGFDTRRGAALALIDRPGTASLGAPLVVLPVGEGAKLEGLVARLARERLGASVRTVDPGPPGVVSFRRAAGEPPMLAYAVAERTLLLARGADGPALVAEAARLAPAASVAEAPAWALARRALGDRFAAIAWAPPGSSAIARLWPVKDGLALGFGGAGNAVRLAAAVLLGAREPSFRALAAQGGHGADLARRLDPGAAAVGVYDGDPGVLGRKLVPLLDRRTLGRLQAAGLDAERDLFGPLAPGAAAAVSLARQLDVTGLSEETVREDPLRAVEVEVVAPLRDPAAARVTSDKLVRAAAPPGRSSRHAARPPPAEAGTWRIRTRSGEIAWRIDGDRLALAGGPEGKLARLVERLQGSGDGFRPPTPEAGHALESGLGGAVVDVQHLVGAVRALPDEAFGTGPSGFVMRSVVDRLVEPAARLSAVSLRADLSEGALRLEMLVEARAPAGAAGATP
jgi:hypothetical protein